MLTFRPTAPGSLFTLVALLFLPLYIPVSHAQGPSSATGVPIDTTDSGLATDTVLSSPTDLGGTSSILTLPSSSPLVGSLSPTTTLTTPTILTTPTTPAVITPATTLTTPTTPTTPTTSPTTTLTSTTSTGTPKTAEPTTTVSPSSSNKAAAGLPARAHVAAALVAGGIGALIAMAV